MQVSPYFASDFLLPDSNAPVENSSETVSSSDCMLALHRIAICPL